MPSWMCRRRPYTTSSNALHFEVPVKSAGSSVLPVYIELIRNEFMTALYGTAEWNSPWQKRKHFSIGTMNCTSLYVGIVSIICYPVILKIDLVLNSPVAQLWYTANTAMKDGRILHPAVNMVC